MTEPTEPHSMEPAASLARDELLEVYKIAVEEYRFQVRLNADRSRDFIVLNSAIIAAAITLLGQARMSLRAGMVFLIGFAVAVLSALGTHTQHGYYRDARNRTAQLEERLGIRGKDDRDLVLYKIYKTKPTGSRYRRFGSITNFNYIILGLLCLVDLIGALFSFGVIPSPNAPTAITQAAPGQRSAAPRPRNASPAPSKRSSSGPVRPSPAAPHHP
jgi:hypothetical protein